ncbi:UPF0001 protein YggS [hydrothermal vent metagenome]|uniref:UPF0001 protein YggS n=1 Tax=hydrothermal vent metagenome TaxID=652676 RepID=A0A3B1C878_9ZZZZ
MIAKNILKISARIEKAAIRAGRDPSEVTLVCVSKTVDARAAMAAVEAGGVNLGESRAQEARRKFEKIGDRAIWHMIGYLQTNKAKYCPGLFSLVHSIDRVELVHELARRAGMAGAPIDGLLQVNISGEKSKHGCAPSEAADILKIAAREKWLNIKGLMTIAPYNEEPDRSRPVYRSLLELRDDIIKVGIEEVSMDIISAGMTNDFEVAIEEGATMVRVGTAIFGERNYD